MNFTSYPAHRSFCFFFKVAPQATTWPKLSWYWSCLVSSNFLSRPTLLHSPSFSMVKVYLTSNYFNSLSGSHSLLWELSKTFVCASGFICTNYPHSENTSQGEKKINKVNSSWFMNLAFTSLKMRKTERSLFEKYTWCVLDKLSINWPKGLKRVKQK